ncbi:MAG: hypothetical protein LBV23_07670 [Deltaproteobacteria bacterium]|nr:hypothetical protein [Deltaproteobacteria bacterium]
MADCGKRVARLTLKYIGAYLKALASLREAHFLAGDKFRLWFQARNFKEGFGLMADCVYLK